MNRSKKKLSALAAVIFVAVVVACLIKARPKPGKVTVKVIEDRFLTYGDRFALSPDGKFIASQGRLIDTNGKVLRKFASPLYGSTVAWSPDSRQLVFSGDSGRGIDIFIVNLDGGARKRLTDFGKDVQKLPREPIWSPDGTKIAFLVNEHNDIRPFLHVYDLTSGHIKQWARVAASLDYRPCWSPDGKWILYLSNNTVTGRSGGELWMVRVSSGKTKRLIGGLCEGAPAYSPDGKTVAFSMYAREETKSGQITHATQSFRLYLIGASGRRLRRITKMKPFTGAAGEYNPVWSPDGNWMVYERHAVPYRHLWLVNIKTGKALQLTSGPEDDRHPTFSPDGKHIYYISRKFKTTAQGLVSGNEELRRLTLRFAKGQPTK